MMDHIPSHTFKYSNKTLNRNLSFDLCRQLERRLNCPSAATTCIQTREIHLIKGSRNHANRLTEASGKTAKSLQVGYEQHCSRWRIQRDEYNALDKVPASWQEQDKGKTNLEDDQQRRRNADSWKRRRRTQNWLWSCASQIRKRPWPNVLHNDKPSVLRAGEAKADPWRRHPRVLKDIVQSSWRRQVGQDWISEKNFRTRWRGV